MVILEYEKIPSVSTFLTLIATMNSKIKSIMKTFSLIYNALNEQKWSKIKKTLNKQILKHDKIYNIIEVKKIFYIKTWKMYCYSWLYRYIEITPHL